MTSTPNIALLFLVLIGSATTAQPTPDAQSGGRSESSAEPSLITVDLADGSVVTGQLAISHLTVETEFGQLRVPIAKIERFTPGLDGRPKFGAKLANLIAKLGDDDVQQRDAAQRQLLAIGEPLRRFLVQHLSDHDAERKLRVETIIEELDQMLEGSEGSSKPHHVIAGDTVVTTTFTIVGQISPKSFKIMSRYGPLTVSLADIVQAAKPRGKKPSDTRKTVIVDGTHLVPMQFKSSGVRLKRGQRVTIKASGELKLTPWGQNAVSTPDGAPNYGWHVPNQIPNGSLVARVGKASQVFKVGSSHRFTAKRAGLLEFAIGMHPNQVNRDYPGEYEVHVRVRSGK